MKLSIKARFASQRDDRFIVRTTDYIRNLKTNWKFDVLLYLNLFICMSWSVFYMQ